MTTPTESTEQTETNSIFDSNEIPTDEQLSKIIDSVNLDNPEIVSTALTTNPPAAQSEIRAKIEKKLETLAASTKENKQTNGNAESSATSNDDGDLRRNSNKIAKNLLKTLTDPDPQKNLLNLATQFVQLQEQNRAARTKITELEKRSNVYMRERDQLLQENSRITGAKTKLESLCRELHRHNQQVREESIQRQRDEEVKRRELATKFQTTIDEIASQLASYSEKSTSLREQNIQLSDQLANVVKDYEIREKEMETELKKKELELRLTEASLEQSHTLLNERTELMKQERQVSEAERLVLYKKYEELTASELSLRSQVTMYSERYQEFQKAIQQSSQMVTSCHKEIEKMGKRIKVLEKERDDYRHRSSTHEQSVQKLTQDHKLLDKEKRQLETKLDKLDKLCRALQQERVELQTTIRGLSKPSATNNQTDATNQPSKPVTPSTETVSSTDTTNNGHEPSVVIQDNDKSVPSSRSDYLYDSELGRIAKTVD